MKRVVVILSLVACWSGMLAIGRSEAQETSDPRRSADWEFLRQVNLGPKAGNGVFGNNMAMDRERNRVFIGNLENISVVDLQLQTVTSVIEDSSFDRVNLALDEKRQVLYVRTMGSDQLSVVDLNTLEIVRTVRSLGISDRRQASEYPHPMAIDTAKDRLFVTNASTVVVVDLNSLRDIGLVRTGSSQSVIMDMALDEENQLLYLADMTQSAIRGMDLSPLDQGTRDITRAERVIKLDLDPVQLARDASGRGDAASADGICTPSAVSESVQQRGGGEVFAAEGGRCGTSGVQHAGSGGASIGEGSSGDGSSPGGVGWEG